MRCAVWIWIWAGACRRVRCARGEALPWMVQSSTFLSTVKVHVARGCATGSDGERAALPWTDGERECLLLYGDRAGHRPRRACIMHYGLDGEVDEEDEDDVEAVERERA